MNEQRSNLPRYAATGLLIIMLALPVLLTTPATHAEPVTRGSAAQLLAQLPPPGPALGGNGSNLRLASDDTAPDTTPRWVDGAVELTYDLDCTNDDPNPDIIMTEQVGYLGNAAATYPRVGDVYYIHVVLSSIGGKCGGPFAHLEINLPDNTTFAVSDENPVFCQMFRGDDWQELTIPGGICPQAPQFNSDYGWAWDQADDQPWNLSGHVLFLSIPVVSTSRVSGIGEESELMAVVHVLDGMTSPLDLTTQQVLVPDNPITVAYDAPSVTRIARTSAHAQATVMNHYFAGSAYFDWGASANYGHTSPPQQVPDEHNSTPLATDFTGLTVGTTYHWRVRFVGADGQVANGDDHVFRTPGPGAAPMIDTSGSYFEFLGRRLNSPPDTATLTIANTGTAPLKINSIALTGDNRTDFSQQTTCPGSIAPGAGCTVTISFKPTATGPRTANLVIKSNAANGNKTLPISAYGSN